jgi:predicted ArsR family transcriptional regulator
MQTTKQQILALLKRTGGATVEEAAGALSIASMTARQHLVSLERDGVLEVRRVKRRTGRPHFLYRLTPKGEDMFPRRYDLLASLLFEEVGELAAAEIAPLTPDQKRSLLIERVADRLIEQHRPMIAVSSLERRVSGVTELLQTIGGFAEWCPCEGGFEIRDYNCVFSKLAPAEASDCEWHVRLLTKLLDRPVRHEVVQEGCGTCCRYVVVASAEGVLSSA